MDSIPDSEDAAETIRTSFPPNTGVFKVKVNLGRTKEAPPEPSVMKGSWSDAADSARPHYLRAAQAEEKETVPAVDVQDVQCLVYHCGQHLGGM